MMKLKGIFTYSLAIVGLFSLTAISCEDSSELLDITVPTSIDESFDIVTSEAKDTSFVRTINPSEEEIQDYKDRIKGISADKLIINVIDNGSNGNTASGAISIITEYGTYVVREIEDLNDLDGFEIDLSGDLQSILISSLENFESFDVEFAVSSTGAIDYTISVTIEGVITASPVSSN